MAIHKPKWFKSGQVIVSSAPTCGINKDGNVLYVVDRSTGERTAEVDDKLREDVKAARSGIGSETLQFVPLKEVARTGIAVPTYFDSRYEEAFHKFLKSGYSDFDSATLGELIDDEIVAASHGHGSPSADQRTGTVPYIKVSDLRAGFININPTNMVPWELAQAHWRGESSGLHAFDLITPARASKNIGDFCVLMPGQEHVVLTKEVLVLRPGVEAHFDPFYLLWAMTLNRVRAQWDRVILMQTNREDVGDRYREIVIPVPPSSGRATEVSESFRSYYTTIAEARAQLTEDLDRGGQHHFHIGVAEEVSDDA